MKGGPADARGSKPPSKRKRQRSGAPDADVPSLRIGERRTLVRRLSLAGVVVLGAFAAWLAYEGRWMGVFVELFSVAALLGAHGAAKRAEDVEGPARVLVVTVALNTLVFTGLQGGLEALTPMWGGTIVIVGSLLVSLRFAQRLGLAYALGLVGFVVLHHVGIEPPRWGLDAELWYLDRGLELVGMIAVMVLVSGALHAAFARAIAREREDQSKLAEAGRRLAEAARELEEARRSTSPEMASLSHDVRNLLGAARLELQMLQEVVPEPMEELSGALEAVESARDLTVAMMEGPVPPGDESADLGAVLDAVTRVTRSSTAQRARVEVRAEHGLQVAGARRDLERVLFNLVLNAAEAQPEGRPVIRIDAAEDPHHPDRVLVEVSDDGPGISPVLEARLFERGASTKGQGRGLGLFGAREVLARMGGSIRFVRTPGPGACFQLRLIRESSRSGEHPLPLELDEALHR
ncbi:MAG: HAMP domain-containing sensor histidine kinase [Myxococcota bacterium]